jgi:hypothetical protein
MIMIKAKGNLPQGAQRKFTKITIGYFTGDTKTPVFVDNYLMAF